MINLFELNEENVEIFPQNRIKAAKKHFNEGWWKGLTVGVVGTYVGAALGLAIVAIINKKGA